MSVHYVPARKPTPDVLGALLEAKVGPEQVELESIQTNGGTQMRAGLNAETVGEYMQTLKDSNQAWPFPPVTLYYDGETYWLGDGFHRVAAARQTGRTGNIPAEIRAGTRRDAVLYAAGANANHGLRRTNADKRQAVETLLRDEEWAAWSDREVARICAVHHEMVGRVRLELSGGNRQMNAERTVTRGGQTYTQNVSNIGTNQPVYAEVWRLQHVVQEVFERFYDADELRHACNDMRMAARTRTGGFWINCERSMPDDIKDYRKSDLSQAINNLAAQKEAKLADAPKTAQPAMHGITAHTWEGYEDWTDADDAEYAELAPIWQQPAGSFNSLSEYNRITRWRVAARLASERLDNLSSSLQDTARHLRLAERCPAPVSNAAAEPIVNRSMTPVLLKGILRQWLGKRYEDYEDSGYFIYQMLDNWMRREWLTDLEAFKATLQPGWPVEWLDQAIRELHAHFAPDPEEQAMQPVSSLNDLVVVSVTAPVNPEPENPLDYYDDESATVAAKRMNKLHTLKGRFLETVDLFKDFGELTGRNTATLLAGRELAHLIDILDAEMDDLQKGMRGV